MSGALVAATFPGVKWQGASDIHRSIFRNFAVPVSRENEKDLMKVLMHAGFPQFVWGLLHETFPQTEEWILNEGEFVALTVVDLYRHLKGEGSSKTSKMIKNPATGNIFHRLGFKGEVVLGIRYWVQDYGDGSLVGFRVRVTTDSGDPVKVRESARNTIEEQLEMVGEILDVLQIAEPSASEIQMAKSLLKMSESEDD